MNTGGPYYAPPIPYGHYTGKNLGGKLGKVGGLLHGGVGGLFHKGACGELRRQRAASLRRQGRARRRLFHHGARPCGDGCGDCGGGHGGSLRRAAAAPAATAARRRPSRRPRPRRALPQVRLRLLRPRLDGHPQRPGRSPQAVAMPSAQCGDPGCGLFAKHRHKGCGLCGGRGCGNCASYDPCGVRRQGLRPLRRRLATAAAPAAARAAASAAARAGCGLCGGKGCAACAKAKGWSAAWSTTLLHRDKIKWFVGPGGPVPLTPGYTPYVITTRSPRDFLAFPPFVP